MRSVSSPPVAATLSPASTRKGKKQATLMMPIIQNAGQPSVDDRSTTCSQGVRVDFGRERVQGAEIAPSHLALSPASTPTPTLLSHLHGELVTHQCVQATLFQDSMARRWGPVRLDCSDSLHHAPSG